MTYLLGSGRSLSRMPEGSLLGAAAPAPDKPRRDFDGLLGSALLAVRRL